MCVCAYVRARACACVCIFLFCRPFSTWLYLWNSSNLLFLANLLPSGFFQLIFPSMILFCSLHIRFFSSGLPPLSLSLSLFLSASLSFSLLLSFALSLPSALPTLCRLYLAGPRSPFRGFFHPPTHAPSNLVRDIFFPSLPSAEFQHSQNPNSFHPCHPGNLYGSVVITSYLFCNFSYKRVTKMFYCISSRSFFFIISSLRAI